MVGIYLVKDWLLILCNFSYLLVIWGLQCKNTK